MQCQLSGSGRLHTGMYFALRLLIEMSCCYQGSYLPNYEPVQSTQESYGLHRLDHAVRTVSSVDVQLHGPAGVICPQSAQQKRETQAHCRPCIFTGWQCAHHDGHNKLSEDCHGVPRLCRVYHRGRRHCGLWCVNSNLGMGSAIVSSPAACELHSSRVGGYLTGMRALLQA